MDLKWNVGGCGTDCGGSGLVEHCDCSMCVASCAAVRYELAVNTIPGGCTYGPIEFQLNQQCNYTQDGNGWLNGSTTLGGGGPGSQAIFINGMVLIALTRAPDGLLLARFWLVPEDGDGTNCNQRFVYDSAREPEPPFWYSMSPLCQTIDPDPANTYFQPVTSELASDLVETYVPPGSGNCCPCDECGLFYDPINRLDSDDPGDLWTEVSGDWYVEEAGLRSDDADAIILANMTAPAGVEMRTTIVPRLGNAGDYNLILGYTDADNYFRVCWTYGGTESAASDTLKLYQMEAGVETELTLTSELAQEEYDGGPGWLLIGCINATRTHLTGYVRSTNDVPVLLSSAQISAADVGDQAGLGEVTAASGSYRSPTINVVSTDCQTCPSYVTCASTAGIAPCANNLAPREWLITLPGGWVQPAPIGGFTGNACCPQWSSASVVAEFMPEVSAAGFFPGADPLSKLYCVWLYEVQMHIPPDTADEMGCTSFPVYRFFVLLVPESAGGTQFRWHAYAKMRNANNIYTDMAEWLSDPYEIGEFDCQSPFSIPVKAITDEHPGDMAHWAGQSYCDGAMGSPLLVEPV